MVGSARHDFAHADGFMDGGRRLVRSLPQRARLTAALTIGSPILFASVAHGSAHDIAGKGIASSKAMIDALLRLSKAKNAR
jgi:hypothetical protein